MAIVEMYLNRNQSLTPEQHDEIKRAKDRPIVYDDDSPETTAELYELYEPIAAEQRNARLSEIITRAN